MSSWSVVCQSKSACVKVRARADVFAVQVYPTAVRSLGMGFCTSFSRIGGMIAPFIAQVGPDPPAPPLLCC